MQNASSFRKLSALTLLCFGTTMMAGCSQNVKDSKATPQSLQQDTSVKSKSAVSEDKPIYTHIPPDVMYKVLVAEMLLKKNQAASAYPLMYSAAKETRNPELAERAFQLSMTTMNIQAVQDATDLWRDISPEKALPWKASYIMSVRAGDQEQAFQQWLKYKSLSKSPLESLLIEAGLKVSQSATKKNGLLFIKKLQSTYPDEAASYFALGVAAANYNEFWLAIPPLEKAASMYADKVASYRGDEDEQSISPQKMEREIYLLLATVYLKSGEVKQGLKKIDAYLDDHEDDWELQEKYARLEVKAGLFKAAEKRYLNVVAHEPAAYTSRLSAALLQLERQAYEVASKNLEMLRPIPQYRSVATYYLGVASQEQGKSKAAVQYFKAVKTEDYYLDARLHIAEIEFPKDGLKKTLSKLDKLEAKTDEQKVKLYRAQAVFYKLSGKKQKAVNAYQNALQLDPNNIGILLTQAMLLYDLKQFSAYEKNIQKALVIDPDDVEALNALAYYYVERKQHLAKAKKMLDKALKLAPNRFYILDSRGWLAYQEGNYREAERYLEKAFSQQLDDEVLMHLIETKWRLGKHQEATTLWKRYHAKFPKNQRLQTLVQDLKKGR
ncbi:MAG: tetratricopeptide repeat protein [Hydrogenovibrio sp.]|nr:tetratricopeptide repeat protein [Hydrogenovibrio sp.]